MDERGRWWGSGSSDAAILTPAASREEEKPPLKIELQEHERLGGHTISKHVEKTDAELVERLQKEFFQHRVLGLVFVEVGSRRAGSFPSLNEAAEYIDKTLEANRDMVDAVASGRKEEAFLTRRFGFVTGREAVVVPVERAITVRRTYGVGVLIIHDKRSSRRFQSANGLSQERRLIGR